MVYDSIQERIFNDYFEQTSELSNLYSWMIDPGPNEFFINNFVNELSNINNFLDVGGSDYDCNIKDHNKIMSYGYNNKKKKKGRRRNK